MKESIPIDYGIPVNGIQIGLYFYPKDRFLFVSDDEDIINTIQILLRSKILLSKLHIHMFKNWDHTIIDNTVCSHWGVEFENSNPVLVDRFESDLVLAEIEFFANMIYWIEKSITSLISSKSFVVGNNPGNLINSALELFDDGNLTNMIESDKQRSIEFDTQIARVRNELHKICYWAKSKQELIARLSDFVADKNMYNQLFYREVLDWWKLN